MPKGPCCSSRTCAALVVSSPPCPTELGGRHRLPPPPPMPPTTQVAVSNRFVLSSGHAVLLGLFATYAALGLFGYGTDGDTYLLLRSGHHLFVHGVYEYSRTPGYVVPEVAVGLLSLAGGHVLSNLASALLGTATLYLFR